MSSTDMQELVDLPREFLKDGLQFINRCQKRMPTPFTGADNSCA
jgi:hypothetical protein